MNDHELRYVDTDFDIRSTGHAGGDTLVGHAAVFNTETVISGFFRELIAPRAFKKSIKESDIRALFNHDTNIVLGRNKAGTLRLSEDDIGLAYEIDLPDTQAARDLWTLIDRGDISQSSFAFDPLKEQRAEPDKEAGETLPLFTVREARLYDVSPVTYPAYDSTDVAARARRRMEAAGFWLPTETRACGAVRDLPIADKGGGWDGAAASAHMQGAAGGENWQPVLYRRGFLYYDASAPELLGSYKLPFADVRGGSLKAVPEGIYACAQRLNATDIPAADKTTARAVLSAYYQRMGETAPWDRSADPAAATTGEPPTEPQTHSEDTPQPEPKRKHLSIVLLQ